MQTIRIAGFSFWRAILAVSNIVERAHSFRSKLGNSHSVFVARCPLGFLRDFILLRRIGAPHPNSRYNNDFVVYCCNAEVLPCRLSPWGARNDGTGKSSLPAYSLSRSI